jgi:hypothetical protein
VLSLLVEGDCALVRHEALSGRLKGLVSGAFKRGQFDKEYVGDFQERHFFAFLGDASMASSRAINETQGITQLFSTIIFDSAAAHLSGIRIDVNCRRFVFCVILRVKTSHFLLVVKDRGW